MKKTLSVLLLFVFLFNIAGVLCLYSVLLNFNYDNIFTRGAEEMNFVTLTFPKTESIHWQNNHEIIYNGRCYDVLHKSEDNGNYSLLCYADSKEDLLNDILNKHVSIHQKQNTAQKNGNGNFSIKVFIQDIILPSAFCRFNVSSREKSLLQISFTLRSGFVSVFSPPPDLITA